MKGFKIGDLSVNVPVVLAPMAGYTDTAMRHLCARFHCGLTFTEVANAAGIVHGSKPTLHIMETKYDIGPVVAHMYGSDPGVMAEAAVIVERLGRFDAIDINCGCPVRKIVSKGAGAALIRKPERIGEIIAEVKNSVSLPVTIKTRIGFSSDEMNIIDILHAAENAGADAISVHARFATSKHSGGADWDTLAEVKDRASIPVIGNGGIASASDVLDMLSRTGVDAVMIGRAAIGNPWIFDEVVCLLQGDDHTGHTDIEHRDLIEEHLRMLTDLKAIERLYRRRRSLPPDVSASLHFRGHLAKYLAGRTCWANIRRGLHYVNSPALVMQAVDAALM